MPPPVAKTDLGKQQYDGSNDASHPMYVSIHSHSSLNIVFAENGPLEESAGESVHAQRIQGLKLHF